MKITIVFLTIVWTFGTIEPASTNRDSTVEDVYLRYYNGDTFDEYIEVQLGSATDLLKAMSTSCSTMLYAFGYTESPTSLSVETIVTAYLATRPNTNIIVIDWSNMNSGLYPTAVDNTKTVGEAVAVQVHNLLEAGLDLATLHVVGHSLGGQIVGYLGRNLESEYKVSLPRITALDPAGVEYYPDTLIVQHLTATDAVFVDVIHTDAEGYGYPLPCGSVDFWPNGGKALQPGCNMSIPLSDESYCSHHKSWYFYAESVRTPYIFPASPKRCSSRSKSDPEEGIIYMGIDCPTSATENFYLTTNSKSPLGKGTAGLDCETNTLLINQLLDT